MNIELAILDQEQIPYQIRKSQKAKRMSLRITKDGLEVVLPKRWSYELLKAFVATEVEWIKKKLHKQDLQQTKIKDSLFAWPKAFEKGIYLPFEGDKRPVIIDVCEKVKMAEWSYDDVLEQFNLRVNNRYALEEIQDKIGAKLIKWYYARAEQAFRTHIAIMVPVMKAPLNGIKIKQQRRLWGSCSTTGNINLNWMLILMPTYVLQYIVVHELCHLFHPNHSKRFWDTVENYCPDYKISEKWLKQHSGQVLPPSF